MNTEQGLAQEGPDAAQEIFDQAVDLAPHEQMAFLDAAVGGNVELRAYVSRLLAHDTKARAEDSDAGPLSSPVVVRPPAVATLLRDPSRGDRRTNGNAANRDPLPTFIGPYRVLSLISAGGMGVVYEAQQDNPRRIVAVKVIRGGLFTDSSLPRFKQEAQILGRLQHPGIARVYEAGVDDAGQPYFAMEMIQGEPLDAYVRSHNIDAKGRLSLIADVCDAVQHAHDRGIIHRDLKPGNILVDETGKPKIVDFGIARATDSDLRTTRAQTAAGELIGTLSYMSPEQLKADPAALDHRLDVYALGVILYELLANRLPCHIEHLPIHEVARAIMEEEPARLGSINRLYRGDVEIIVAKTLSKEKERRYATAAALADDIRRCLNHQPIQARAPSLLYQFRKFARRNKALVGGVIGILLALCCGAVGMTVFALSEAEQHRRADANARTADANARTADANARDANIEKQRAHNEAYRSRIAAALAALQSDDVGEAALQLADAPEALRGWEWHYLHARLDESAAVLDPAGEKYVLLVPTADAVLVATASETRLHVLDLEGREHLSLPWRPDLELWNYMVSPRGIRYLVAKEKKKSEIGLFDGAGKALATLAWQPNANSFLSAAPVIQPDLKRIAIAWTNDSAYRIEICDAANGTCVARCTGHTNAVRALALSADGSRLASGGEDGVARLWDMATGACLAVFRGYKSRINCLAFRPDGASLVTGAADGMIRQWDTRTGKEIAPPWERRGEVTSVVYSPNGMWIASAGADRTIRLWQIAERREFSTLHGHTGDITQLAFTPDGRRLVSSSPRPRSADNQVRVWDVEFSGNLSMLRGHASYVYPVAYSPDDRWIASGSWDGTVRLWDAHTGEACAKLPIGNIVRSLVFSPDGSRLFIGCDGQERLQVWNPATAQRSGVISIPADKDHLQGLAIRPDGGQLAVVSQPGQIMIADLSTGELVTLKESGVGYWEKNPVAYSPDGKWLACTDLESHICILETTHYEQVKKFAGHTANVHSIAWSRDGRQLVSGSADRTVRVWNVDNGECVQKLEGHTDEVYAVAFHPDGTRIASASRNAAIGLWDTVSGKQLLRLKGHTNYVYSLAFSRDGSTLVSGSGDCTVRLWDTEPLAKRIQAKRDADALALEAYKLVARLFADRANAEQVVAAIRADTALSDSQRHAALRAVLRRQAPP